MCSCDGSPIAIDDEVDEGFTPRQLLDLAVFVDVPWTWTSLASEPETLGTASSSYRGGSIVDEVGGCCGSFICGPCPSGVTIFGTHVSITTADGRLDDVFEGLLSGPDEVSGAVRFASGIIPLDALNGTLAGETFYNEGIPYYPTSVRLEVMWEYDGEALVLVEVRLGLFDEAEEVYGGSYFAH